MSKKKMEDKRKMSIFALSESTTLPVEQRTRVELFLFIYVMNIYTKQPLSIDDQFYRLFP